MRKIETSFRTYSTNYSVSDLENIFKGIPQYESVGIRPSSSMQEGGIMPPCYILFIVIIPSVYRFDCEKNTRCYYIVNTL